MLKLAVSICTRILKYRVWIIKFDELDFLSISNSNFAGYIGSKNLVQTRQKFQFIKLDYSNSIFQYPSANRYRAWCLLKKTLKNCSFRKDFNPLCKSKKLKYWRAIISRVYYNVNDLNGATPSNKIINGQNNWCMRDDKWYMVLSYRAVGRF